jgi:hypothetical protein
LATRGSSGTTYRHAALISNESTHTTGRNTAGTYRFKLRLRLYRRLLDYALGDGSRDLTWLHHAESALGSLFLLFLLLHFLFLELGLSCLLLHRLLFLPLLLLLLLFLGPAHSVQQHTEITG